MAYVKLKEFKVWCQKVLPLVYDESLSYYEVLCKLIKYTNTLIENVESLNEILDNLDINLDDLQKDIDWRKEELEKVKNGDYVDLYLDSIISWIDKNIQELVGRIVKYVYFGLTKDGYFCAWIPQSWDFLWFDTIITPDSELYGHLVLQW